MRRALLVLSLCLTAPAMASDVGISVSVGQPGFYGRIDIGDYPPPQVVYAEPVIIHRPPPRVVYEPIYVHVPPHHARDWRRHCGHYGYCGRPVYFVQDNWYREVYVPRHTHRPPSHQRHDRGHRHEESHRRDYPRERGHDRD